MPDDCDRIMYLDGDMQLVGDAAPLLRLDVPEGRIAAAARNFVMFEGPARQRPGWSEYHLTSLQLDDAGSCFNAGLMPFRRKTWAEIAPRALDVFLTKAGTCAHHDQPALNAIRAGYLLPLSPG
ncbi:glycosyltransferase [Paracoccus beibuensis]|uniref:glycosyltransferase n=1 Tax=Paracoccus beibuensis TaxID=547602 RepID=UPI0022407147|nr:glycosyltransferase [Paracoccus beibuensis]